MSTLRELLLLSEAAMTGALGKHIKSASYGAYEGMRGEYAPIDTAHKEKPGLLSKRSATIALLGGAGSALPGMAGLVGPAAAGLLSEHGHGRAAALGTAAGATFGQGSHGLPGRIIGGALGGALAHEYSRRKAEAHNHRKAANAPAAGGGAVKQPVTTEQSAVTESADFKSDRFRRQRLAELLKRRETTETATGSISPNPPHGDS